MKEKFNLNIVIILKNANNADENQLMLILSGLNPDKD